MLRILSELLNISQVEAGKIQLDIKKVSPYTTADNAIATITNAVKEKVITLQKEYDPNLPDIQGDAEKTTWVLNNFLINAIKYVPANGNIKISIAEDKLFVVFMVMTMGQASHRRFYPKYSTGFLKHLVLRQVLV